MALVYKLGNKHGDHITTKVEQNTISHVIKFHLPSTTEVIFFGNDRHILLSCLNGQNKVKVLIYIMCGYVLYITEATKPRIDWFIEIFANKVLNYL